MIDGLTRLLPAGDETDRTGIIRTMAEVLSLLGGRSIFISSVPLPNTELFPLVLHMDWPDAFAARYMRGRFWADDPILDPHRSAEGFVFSHGLRHLSKAQRTVVEDYASFGIGPMGALTLNRPGRFQIVAAASLDISVDHNAVAIAQAVLQRLADRLFEIAPDALRRHGELTQRERQIVAETALGKTSAEIGDSLGISARTVFAHLTAAGAKLAAPNKTGTVVQAIRYAQIAA